MWFESLSSGCLCCSESLGLISGRFFPFSFSFCPAQPPAQCQARVRVKRRSLRHRAVAFWSLFNFALPTLSSAQSRGATGLPYLRVTWYTTMYGPACHLLFFVCCICSTLFFRLSTSPPSRDCRCGHLPSRVFVFFLSNPPPRRWPAGFFLHDFSLVLAPVFPSISTRARLPIVLFLRLVCRIAFLALPRHTGGMRQVLEPFLPTPAVRGRFLMGICCLVVGSEFPSTAFLRVFLAP